MTLKVQPEYKIQLGYKIQPEYKIQLVYKIK